MKQKTPTPKKTMKRIICEYVGNYSQYQLEGNKHKDHKYNIVIFTPLNNHQSMLYNRALYGLSVYTPEEIQNMHWEKRKRIIKVHKRAQSALNIWKQEITNTIATAFFTAIFPKTEVAVHLEETVDETDPNFINKISFKDLGITKVHIINKLIENAILPANFYDLKPLTTCK